MNRSTLPRNLIVGSLAVAALLAITGRALSAVNPPEAQPSENTPSKLKAVKPLTLTPSKRAADKAAEKLAAAPSTPASAEPANKAVEPAGDEKPANTSKESADEPEGKTPAPRGAKTEHSEPNAHAAKTHAPAPSKNAGEETSALSADDALARLTEGNTRWSSGEFQNPNTSSERRAATASDGQHPFVTILTCADSRIPVERVFDQGVGDVFVVRVAGNVSGSSETGTIEYGVEHLKTPLLVVMGHTKCGAVAAAASNADVHGKVAGLVANIKPAVERARKAHPDLDANALAAEVVSENVWQSIFDLYKNSPDLRNAANAGTLKVVGAVYDISTGKVNFMGEHPWQAALLQALSGNAPATANAEGEEKEHH